MADEQTPPDASADADDAVTSPAAAQAEAAIGAAEEAVAELDELNVGPKPFDLSAFGADANIDGAQHGIDLLADVNLDVRIELGRTRMLVEDILRLGSGSVVELDKLAGDPVDIYVNDRHVARGEVLVLNDNFCVRVSEIIDATGSGGPEQVAATESADEPADAAPDAGAVAGAGDTPAEDAA